jgi:hypothetical protein
MTGTAVVVLAADKQLASGTEIYPVPCHRPVTLCSTGSVQ